jgi:hypothetical protein
MAIAPEEGMTAAERAAINNTITARSAAAAANPFNALVSRLNVAAVKAEDTVATYEAAQAEKAAFDPNKAPEVAAWQEEMKKISKEVGGAISPVTGNITQKPTTASLTGQQVDSIAAISALLSSYGIGDLSEAITNAVINGYSKDTIQLIMQDPNSTDPLALAFQKRFPANKERLAAGKSVLSPAEYLRAERSYTEVLQSYGVANLATTQKLSQFISNDISATEVADRVGLAINRVQNADADTKKALAEYYPMLNQADIVGALLDPADALPALKRKIQIAEIGGAALSQGIKTAEGKTNIKMGAEALANLGVTQEQARAGFKAVAEVAPRGEFLSQISPGEDYTQLQAEQEAFQGLASAKQARIALTEQEKARFSGSAGRLASKNRAAGLI